MRLLICLLLVCGSVGAVELGVCKGDFALCAASPTTLTGKTMTVNGKTFRQGMAVCPILTGDSFADMSMIKSCTAPAGKVWSLFSAQSSYPQAPSWAVAPAVFRQFTIGKTAETGMSNMWSYLCDVQAQPVNGAKLATCYGPVMESPWTHNHVKPGQIGFSQSPAGATYGVGGNAP